VSAAAWVWAALAPYLVGLVLAVGGTHPDLPAALSVSVGSAAPEQRGTVRGLSGESLLEPGRTIGLDDLTGQVVVLNVWARGAGLVEQRSVHKISPSDDAPSY
jgi:hypothetical protein